jgi:hypothetical protein
MPPHREAQKKYCSRAFAAALVIGGSLILAGLPALGKGLIVGAFFSILNFLIMAESISHRLAKTHRRAAVTSFLWLLPRYALMAIPLVLSLKFNLFHPATAAAGLFAVQTVILVEHLVHAFTPPADGSA